MTYALRKKMTIGYNLTYSHILTLRHFMVKRVYFQVANVTICKYDYEMNWSTYLAEYKKSDSFQSTLQHVRQRREAGVTVYPPACDVFNAFRYCSFDDIKVVILGQDPYHGPNQAHGLCFSVKRPIKPPPSLVNIYKELIQDVGIALPSHGDLTGWAKQGVFLLNTVMTVEAGNAYSHQGIGWEQFTDHVIAQINAHRSHVVFLLWGAAAQKKQPMLDSTKHTILCAPHPSPLSAHRGFLGCHHFSLANQALIAHNQSPINWSVE